MADAAIPPGRTPKDLVQAHAYLGADGSPVDWTKIFLGYGGMVVGYFMATLDIQIVASSLAEIQAGVGASADEISWVQTIYLLTEVVVMPVTAYLTKLWGTRPFYIGASIAFLIASVLTGLSTSIEMMIVCRGLQGLAAGAMIPPVFATAMTVFPPERRITANIIMGMIVTLAPTIGPTLGGHVTEALNWRWLFFINLPPGLLVIWLVGRYGGFDKADPSLAKGIDWPGLAAMTVFLLSAQYVFEEGASEGWYKDDLILWLGVLAVVTGGLFVWRQLSYRQPILSLTPFRDRNFTLGVMMNFVTGMSLFGGTFVIPLFLGQVQRLSAAEVGTTMLVSGLTMFVTSPVLGRFVRMVDPRVAMVVGFGLATWGIGLGAQITEDWDFWDFAVLQAVRGVGVMIAMIASQQMSIATLPVHMMKDASAILNLVRNVGGAIGLAALSTILGVSTAAHYAELTALVNAGSQASQDMLAAYTAMYAERGAADPEGAARKVFSLMIHQQASVLGFADAYTFLAAGCGIAAVLSIFAKPAPDPYMAAPPLDEAL